MKGNLDSGAEVEEPVPKYWSKDWFLKHGLFNSMKPAPRDSITLEAQFMLVLGLVIGTAGYWGRMHTQEWRGREMTHLGGGQS